MPKVIRKYPLTQGIMNEIEMPRMSIVLCVQAQRDIPCLWVFCDSESREETRWFHILPTGENAENAKLRNYIGTYQIENGAFVGHVFEVR